MIPMLKFYYSGRNRVCSRVEVASHTPVALERERNDLQIRRTIPVALFLHIKDH